MENKNYTWATEEIYANLESWEEDFNKAKLLIDFSAYRGQLGNKAKFLECMKKEEELSRILDKLSVFAMMKHDENTKDSVYDSLVSKISTLGVEIGAQTAYIMPELTALDQSVLEGFILDPELSEYDFHLKTVLKQKKHVLSEKEETILAQLGDTMRSFRDIFTKIDNADLPLKKVKSGLKTYQLTHGTYGMIMHTGKRSLRKKAFKSYYDAYISLINTISSTYYGNVKKNVFSARIRKFDSVLQMALDGEGVPETVYHTLIKTVHEALPIMHEYVAEKKKALNLKEMHMYDMNMPIVKNAELSLSYDDAYDLVVEGLSVLGKEYKDLLIKAKEKRWIDVYEKDGKRSGAYSVAVYDTHPYVLLNYQKTTHDVFTIAHEMGHSIHSYFSNRTQPYIKADYKIFVAEVASTVNEVLLVKYLLSTAEDEKLKKYLLSYLMEMIRTTLFRQTMFAEFEEFSHSSVEKGIPLTKDNMNEEYLKLNKKYYGDAVVSDQEIAYEWARIPHFYRAFYVYKYATGIISAIHIADRILSEGQPAVDDYFKFLSSGGSDDPVELLKIAGVDLTQEKPYKSAFNTFKDALDKFRSL